MKITCESCSAKYSIADDKVAGRTFKIRCKRCGAALSVRGDVAPARPSITHGDWHVVVNDAQEGPFTSEEITAKVEAGDLGLDTFVWKEGMAEWVPLGSVPELAPSASEEDVVTSAPHTNGASASSLTGERNESSVLFSLSNLRGLSPAPAATGSPASATPASAPPSDGSGLIDIRALAALSASAAIAPTKVSSTDELLGFGATGLASAPLGAPIVPPAARVERGRSAVLLAASMIGVAAIAAAVVIAVVLVDQSEGRAMAGAGPLASAPVLPAAVVEPVVEPAPAEAPVAPRVEPPPVSPSAVEAPAPAPTEAETTETEPAREERADRRPARPERPSREQAARPEPSRSDRSDRSPPAERTFERLIDDAVAPRTEPRRDPVTETLPSTPSRGDVVSAMNAVSAPVRACGNGAGGTVPVRIVFSGTTGRVQSAEAQGTTVAPEVRSCVARAVRDAHVPRFGQSTFSVTYPFRI
jgi:predicted Zn finger-like uncharacterized protein